MKHFRPYLYGRRFKLRSDHASLAWLCQRNEPSCQVARWLETLSEFQYDLEHRAGKKHGNADGLSRQKCLDCRQCERLEIRDGGPTRAEVEATLDQPLPPEPWLQTGRRVPLNSTTNSAKVEATLSPLPLRKPTYAEMVIGTPVTDRPTSVQAPACVMATDQEQGGVVGLVKMQKDSTTCVGTIYQWC